MPQEPWAEADLLLGAPETSLNFRFSRREPVSLFKPILAGAQLPERLIA
jgi:hypothetical protein